MNTSLSISPLSHPRESTAKAIYNLFQVSYLIEAKLVGVENFPPLKRSISNIQVSKTQFWGYFKATELAAVVEFELDNNLLEIHSFVVLPKYFKQGIANNLLLHLLNSVQWDSSVVETATANNPAISLYKKFGFVKDEIWITSDGIEKIKLKL